MATPHHDVVRATPGSTIDEKTFLNVVPLSAAQ
jgi:hypothetical protein